MTPESVPLVSMLFQPEQVSEFVFESFSYDKKAAQLTLCYRLGTIPLTEEFVFHGAEGLTPAVSPATFRRALAGLHLAAGVSYYKAAAPKSLIIQNPHRTESDAPGELSFQSAAKFFQKLYYAGLGEFAFQNKLDLTERLQFCTEASETTSRTAVEESSLQNRVLVPLGGGKDSLVTLEELKQTGKELSLLFIGDHAQFFQLADIARVPYVHISRKLSPKLLELNAAGAYNGHVPISSIISFTCLVASMLYDFNSVAISQERSANVGNVSYGDRIVNHQYSKSFEFEADFADFVDAEILRGYQYFSLLRGFSELEIAKRFASLSQYHQIFSSCNKAYRLQSSGETHWCNHCPKCRFIFLALAPHLDPQALQKIFGVNLLADEQQMQGFDELLGVSGFKPFECVGEIEESVAAFYLLSKDPRWSQTSLVKRFAKDLLPKFPNAEAIASQAFEFSNEHRIPQEFLSLLQSKR